MPASTCKYRRSCDECNRQSTQSTISRSTPTAVSKCTHQKPSTSNCQPTQVCLLTRLPQHHVNPREKEHRKLILPACALVLSRHSHDVLPAEAEVRVQSKERLAVSAAQILGESPTDCRALMSTTEAPSSFQDCEAILGAMQALLNLSPKRYRLLPSSHAARLSTGASVSTRSRRPKMRSFSCQDIAHFGTWPHDPCKPRIPLRDVLRTVPHEARKFVVLGEGYGSGGQRHQRKESFRTHDVARGTIRSSLAKTLLSRALGGRSFEGAHGPVLLLSASPYVL